MSIVAPEQARATPEGPLRDPAAADPSWWRRAWAAPLGAHVLVLVVLALAVAPLLGLGTSWSTDEGAYGLQAEQLAEGRWDHPYWAAAADPDGRFQPIIFSERSDGRYHPYVRHPAYPVLLRASAAVAGPTWGPYLPGLAGLVGTAVAAWLVAERLCSDRRGPGWGRGRGRIAFWLAALSPVAFNASVVWAHAPSAALAGLAVWAALAALRPAPRGNGVRSPGGDAGSAHRFAGLAPGAVLRPAPRGNGVRSPGGDAGSAHRFAGLGLAGLAGGAAMVGALVPLVLLRSEGLLFAAALLVAGGLWSVAQRAWRTLAVFASAAAAVGATVLLEQRWIAAVAGDLSSSIEVRQSDGSLLADRLSGAAHVLVQGAMASPALLALATAALLTAGLAAVRLRRGDVGGAAMFAVASAGLYAARFVFAGNEVVPGLLVAWPVVTFALVALRWRSLSSAARFAAGVSALFVGAVLATQYPEGGGLEWGGRFLSPLTAPVAALAAIGLGGVATQLAGDRRRRLLAGLAVAGLLLPVGAGLHHQAVIRARTGVLEAELLAVVDGPIVTTQRHLPRILWRTDGELRWLVASAHEVTDAVVLGERAGVGPVHVLTAARAAPGYVSAGFERVDASGLGSVGMALLRAG